MVFDGYARGPSTKDHEHKRRMENKVVAPDVCFDETMAAVFDQQAFLANHYNK